MARLTLVRHGQARFLAEDYDQLSPVGFEQARALARYWLARGRRFDAIFTGTLRRQIQTAETVCEILRAAGETPPPPRRLPGLDEYPAEEVMRALTPRLVECDAHVAALYADFRSAAGDDARHAALFRLLEAVIGRWIEGDHDVPDLPGWDAFRGRVEEALGVLRSASGDGARIAAFSSAGAIGVCVQTALEAPPGQAIELSWRMRNCALTELAPSSSGMTLDCFNAVPHLTERRLVTYR